jgi:hypothetical protein
MTTDQKGLREEQPTLTPNLTREATKEKREIIVEREEKFEKIEKEAKDTTISKLATLVRIHTLNTKNKVGMETLILYREEAPHTLTHKTRGQRITSNHQD